MNADRIATIHPGIVELWDSARENPDTDYCVTFDLSSDPQMWVQVTIDAGNASYPHQSDPADFVDGIKLNFPLCFKLLAWEAGLYATFGYDKEEINTRELAGFVDWYFELVLSSETSHLDFSIEDLS